MTRAVLLDENSRAAAEGLRIAGFDVEAIWAVAPGINDSGVLALAREHERCLLTFDADFGEMVFARGALPPPAILYFRIHPVVASEVLALASHALVEVSDGMFAVITRDATRTRPLLASTQASVDTSGLDGGD